MTALPNEFFNWLASDDGSLLRADLAAWVRWKKPDVPPEDTPAAFAYMMFSLSEFRSLVDYRARTSADGKGFGNMARERPRANDLNIRCPDIGPGFTIQHGHSTWVLARKIGRDFRVSHNATIGAVGDGRPTLGDDVGVRPSAVVVGPIHIGNNVIVAPTAFVNFNVPDNSYVFAPRSLVVPRKKK